MSNSSEPEDARPIYCFGQKKEGKPFPFCLPVHIVNERLENLERTISFSGLYPAQNTARGSGEDIWFYCLLHEGVLYFIPI